MNNCKSKPHTMQICYANAGASLAKTYKPGDVVQFTRAHRAHLENNAIALSHGTIIESAGGKSELCLISWIMPNGKPKKIRVFAENLALVLPGAVQFRNH